MKVTLPNQISNLVENKREIVRLNGTRPIARGSKRCIYLLPQKPGIILKTKRTKNTIKRLRRVFRASANSHEAYWCAKIHKDHPGCGFVPKIFGMVSTDKGTALAEEYIHNSDGSPALRPTEFIRRFGRSEEVRHAIEALFSFFMDHHVVCNDISEQNILIRTDDKQIQAVAVDGFGENHLVPYPSLFKWMNSQKLERKKQRLFKKLLRAPTKNQQSL